MPLAQLLVAREPSKYTMSIPPLAVVDPKDKAPETPSTNAKKRKLVKASELEPKKMKLLALAMPTTRALEVCHRLNLDMLNPFAQNFV